MAKFKVRASFTTYGNVEVEAKTAEAARLLAMDFDGGDFYSEDDGADGFEIVDVESLEPEEFEVTIKLKLATHQDHNVLSLAEAVNEIVNNAFAEDINYDLKIVDSVVIAGGVNDWDKLKVFELQTGIGFFQKGHLLILDVDTTEGKKYFNVTLEMKGAGTWSRQIPNLYVTPATAEARKQVIDYLKTQQ